MVQDIFLVLIKTFNSKRYRSTFLIPFRISPDTKCPLKLTIEAIALLLKYRDQGLDHSVLHHPNRVSDPKGAGPYHSTVGQNLEECNLVTWRLEATKVFSLKEAVEVDGALRIGKVEREVIKEVENGPQ